MIEELKKRLLLGQDPYVGYTEDNQTYPYAHTNLQYDYFRKLSELAPAGYVVECGSMYGGSAMRMAEACTREIVCIDPFTGDVGMWLDTYPPPANGMLAITNGFPGIRHRFLSNVVAAGFAHRILPLQVTATVGLRVLATLVANEGLARPAMIYVDSSHERTETRHELELAWDLLPTGGVLFGDDWSLPAVAGDVAAFAYANHGKRDLDAEDRLPATEPPVPESTLPGRWHGQHWAMIKADAARNIPLFKDLR